MLSEEIETLEGKPEQQRKDLGKDMFDKMKLDECMAGRKRRWIGIGVLFLLLTGCAQISEKENAVPERESGAQSGVTQSAVMRPSIMQEAEEERDDAEIYWEWAEEWISGMLLENERIEMGDINEGHELFSDEWYDNSNFDGRLTDPYLYVFVCQWKDENQIAPGAPLEQDRTFLSVEDPRRAGDYKGRFIFSIWVKETDHGVELGTDFHQKMFQYILYECSKEHYRKGAYLIGLSPSEQWMEWCPLFDILGEPVVLVSVTGAEKLEPVFRDACERMHERQERISGELGQTVRFGSVFDDDSLAWWDEEPMGYEDFEDRGRWQQYFTYMDEQRRISGYRRWLRRYESYYPEFRLDFHTGYDEEKQNIFREMCACREAYLQEQRGEGQEEQKAEWGLHLGEPQQEGQELWTVKEGDSLWQIAQQQYGDGSLWKRIYERNQEVIGEDENVIFPGQVLELP